MEIKTIFQGGGAASEHGGWVKDLDIYIAYFCRSCNQNLILQCPNCGEKIHHPGETPKIAERSIDQMGPGLSWEYEVQVGCLMCSGCSSVLYDFPRGQTSCSIEQFAENAKVSCPGCKKFEKHKTWKYASLRWFDSEENPLEECVPEEIKSARSALEIENAQSEQQLLEEESKRKENLLEEVLKLQGELAPSAVSFFEDLLSTDSLIIDSNIWMNDQFDDFFSALIIAMKQAGKGMKISSPQLDEICNIKRNSEYRSSQSKSSRCALKRIEVFQINDLLHACSIDAEAKKTVHVDPLLIETVLKQLKEGITTSFVTNDVELRIRLRALASTHLDKLKIFEIEQSETYSAYVDLYGQ